MFELNKNRFILFFKDQEILKHVKKNYVFRIYLPFFVFSRENIHEKKIIFIFFVIFFLSLVIF